DRHMPAVIRRAETVHVNSVERNARENGDSVVAFLSVECRKFVAEPSEALERKGVIRAFGFLQTEDVRPRPLDEIDDEFDAQTDGIDVPGRDFQRHRSSVTSRPRTCQSPATARPGHPRDPAAQGRGVRAQMWWRNPARPVSCDNSYSRSGTCWDRAACWYQDCIPQPWC